MSTFLAGWDFDGAERTSSEIEASVFEPGPKILRSSNRNLQKTSTQKTSTRKMDLSDNLENVSSSPALQCFRRDCNLADLNLVKPCCKQLLPATSVADLFVEIVCSNPKRNVKLAYSFCMNKMVYSELIYHCAHSERCLSFTNACAKYRSVVEKMEH